MLCLAPITIKAPLGYSTRYMEVPCGRCASCLIRRRLQWQFRLEQEQKASDFSCFLTLTYDEQHHSGHVSKDHIQRWLKRFRKSLSGRGFKLRYFIVAEYGLETGRPHYHGLLFFSGSGSISESLLDWLVSESWTYGNIHYGTVSEKSIAYCCKYHITRVDDAKFPDRERTFCLMSRRPGIGFNYCITHFKYHIDDTSRFHSILPGGMPVSLPRYYVDKFYDSEGYQANEDGSYTNRALGTKVSGSRYGLIYSSKQKHRVLCTLHSASLREERDRRLIKSGVNPFNYDVQSALQYQDRFIVKKKTLSKL